MSKLQDIISPRSMTETTFRRLTIEFIIFVSLGVVAIPHYAKNNSVLWCNAWIIFWTFVAIMVNSLATWLLKRISVKQISMSIQPVVMCRISDGNCYIRNIGEGAALYIQSKKISFNMELDRCRELGIHPDLKYIKLGVLPCLEKHSKDHGLPIRLCGEDGKTELGVGSYEQQTILQQYKEFVIEYKDIQGKTYKTRMVRQDRDFETEEFLDQELNLSAPLTTASKEL